MIMKKILPTLLLFAVASWSIYANAKTKGAENHPTFARWAVEGNFMYGSFSQSNVASVLVFLNFSPDRK